MKVLLIDVNYKSGSTGKIVYDLQQGLISDGFDAAVCYGRGEKVNVPNVLKFGIDMETNAHALLTRITGLTGIFSFFSTRKLLRFIRDYKPDVVHIHELHGYFVNIRPVIDYLKANNIRTIWTFHCEFMYTGRCGYTYSCQRWLDSCGSCPNIKEYPKSLFFDFSALMHRQKKNYFHNFNNLVIVTPSNWLKEKVEKSFLQNSRIEVIHNGIDTERIFHIQSFEHLREKHGITDEKIILAVAPGLMQERKGGKWILKLAEMMKNNNVKFILIGVDETDIELGSNVIALGRTENQIELAAYYSMADVFVICSLMENFPTVCLEALCCGTPICGFDTGGTKETAPPEFSSFVAYGSIRKLKENILEVIDQNISPECCESYGQSRYSPKTMYNNYKKLYTSEY